MKQALLACLFVLPLHAQTFDSVSVKPAAPEAPMQGLGFMNPMSTQALPHGLLTMTGPLPPFLVFAYGVQDEVEARAMRARLPDWAQHTKFTIVARLPEDSTTSEQLRIMLRSALEDRFAVKAHRDTHTGTVNTLMVSRPGTTGPNLRPHLTQPECARPGSQLKPNQKPCGLQIDRKEGGTVHVSMLDVTLPEACTLLGGLGGVLGGRGMDHMVDATGLAGTWDITLDFLSDQADGQASETGGPTFTGALEKQLGLRLKKGTGPIEDFIIDHIAQPTAD